MLFIKMPPTVYIDFKSRRNSRWQTNTHYVCNL